MNRNWRHNAAGLEDEKPREAQMPCSRHNSGTGAPASACLRTPMIWLSEILDIFIL